MKPVVLWDEYTRRIEASPTLHLRRRVSGYIERVLYREGLEVRQGDVLFVIDPRSYRGEQARAEAQLAGARSVAANSRSEARRARALLDQHAVSADIWEQRRAADEAAQTEVLAAQAAADVPA